MRKILFISDMHVGSMYGLFPKNYVTSTGNEIELNEIQTELLKYWKKLFKDVGYYDTIILMGDLIQGLNKRESGLDTMISNLNEQENATLELLKSVCENKKVFGVSGTRYHDSADYQIHQSIAEKLGGKYFGALANLRINNKIVHIEHGGGSMPTYMGTKLNKKLLLANAAIGLNKIPEIDVFIHGHFHCFAELRTKNRVAVSLPAWETAKNNQYSVGRYEHFQPDIGAFKMEISDDGGILTEVFLYDIESTRDNIFEV